jgi:putative flippase GtrA
MKLPQKLPGRRFAEKLIAHPLFSKLKELFAYGVVGGMTTLLSMLLYTLFTRVVHLEELINLRLGKIFPVLIIDISNGNYPASYWLTFVACVLFAFFANKHAVFHSKSPNYIKEMILFFGMRLASGGLGFGIMKIGVDLLGMNDLAVYAVSSFIIIILNYLFSKFIIFKKPPERIGSESRQD